MWPASIATEIGPTVALADWRAASLPCGVMSMYPVKMQVYQGYVVVIYFLLSCNLFFNRRILGDENNCARFLEHTWKHQGLKLWFRQKSFSIETLNLSRAKLKNSVLPLSRIKEGLWLKALFSVYFCLFLPNPPKIAFNKKWLSTVRVIRVPP